MRVGFFSGALVGAALMLGCGESSSPANEDAGTGGGTDAASPADAGTGGMDGGPTGTDASVPSDAGPAFQGDAGSCDEWDPGITFGDPIEAPAGEWTFVGFPDSRCMNDTPTGIGINPSDASDGVVIYLQGGGACFDFISCFGVANSGGYGAGELEYMASRSGQRGIFDRDDPDNPVADWSFVFVPYCSGDVHAGSNPDGYGGRTQVGYDNIGEYLERLVPTFAGASHVLLTGSSAGGFGAAYNYDRVAQAFGCTPVTLLDDSGPPMADGYMQACLQQWWRETWNIDDTLPPDCVGCSGPDGGGLSNFARFLGEKYPDRRFGLLSSMEDSVIRSFFGYGYSRDCRSASGMNADLFSEGLVDLRTNVLGPYGHFRTFYEAGDFHTFLGQPLTDHSVEGVTLAEWITQLLEADAGWGDVGP